MNRSLNRAVRVSPPHIRGNIITALTRVFGGCPQTREHTLEESNPLQQGGPVRARWLAPLALTGNGTSLLLRDRQKPDCLASRLFVGRGALGRRWISATTTMEAHTTNSHLDDQQQVSLTELTDPGSPRNRRTHPGSDNRTKEVGVSPPIQVIQDVSFFGNTERGSENGWYKLEMCSRDEENVIILDRLDRGVPGLRHLANIRSRVGLDHPGSPVQFEVIT